MKIFVGDRVKLVSRVGKKYLGLVGEVRVIVGLPFTKRYFIKTDVDLLWCKKRWLERVG